MAPPLPTTTDSEVDARTQANSGIVPLKPQRHPLLYFEGGYVVFSVGPDRTLFRVQRYVLTTYSQVLRAILVSLDGDGESDETPFHLDDDAEHFAGILSVYYGPILMPHPEERTFDYITGVLSLSSKYGFQHSYDWALHELRTLWSKSSPVWLNHLSGQSLELVNQAISLIHLSRRENLAEFLEPAFYLLCVYERKVNSVEAYTALEPSDIILLLQGSRALLRGWVESEIPITRQNPNNKQYTGKKTNVGFRDQPVPSAEPGVLLTWKDYVQSEKTMAAVARSMALPIL